MSIKTIITDNSLASATIGDKTLTRRTEGDQVIYDGASGGGGSSVVGSGTVVNASVRNGNLSGSTRMYAQVSYYPYPTVGYEVPSGVSKIVYLGAGGPGGDSGLGSGYIGGTIPQNAGSYNQYTSTIQYLGNDQNFQVWWGWNHEGGTGEFDNKVYIFSVVPDNGSWVWTSINLLLI